MPAMTRPRIIGAGPRSSTCGDLGPVREGGDEDADDDERDRPARQRLPARFRGDLELDVDLVRQDRPQLAEPLVAGPQALDDLAQDRQGVRGRMGRGQGRDLVADLDGLPVALVALLRRIALGDEALGLAGLLEEGPRARPATVSASARRSRADDRLSRSRSSWARASSPCSTPACGLRDRLLRDLQPARVLVALGRQVVERLVELLAGAARPAVRAADRRLQPVAQGSLVAGEVGELLVADGRRSSGRSPRSGCRSARR